MISEYAIVLFFDISLFLTVSVYLLLTRRRSWLGAFRPVVFRLACVSLVARFVVSFFVSSHTYLLLVVLVNCTHGLMWLWAFTQLDILIKRPDIRAVQIWVHTRKVELVCIYKHLQGDISAHAPSAKFLAAAACPICLETLAPCRADRRALSLTRQTRRLNLSNRTHTFRGVAEIHTTPCKHKFHAACLARIVDRLCPLCKTGVGVTTRRTFPFP